MNSYFKDPNHEPTATEIMLYGWPVMRPISETESDYWDKHLLPSGCWVLSPINALEAAEKKKKI